MRAVIPSREARDLARDLSPFRSSSAFYYGSAALNGASSDPAGREGEDDLVVLQRAGDTGAAELEDDREDARAEEQVGRAHARSQCRQRLEERGVTPRGRGTRSRVEVAVEPRENPLTRIAGMTLFRGDPAGADGGEDCREGVRDTTGEGECDEERASDELRKGALHVVVADDNGGLGLLWRDGRAWLWIVCAKRVEMEIDDVRIGEAKGNGHRARAGALDRGA